METRIHNNLALYGSLIMSVNEPGFPENPAIGTLIIKGNCLYAYISVGGYVTWYPFASKTSSYIHSQGVASSTWTVTHDLNTTNTWTQVKDSNGIVVQALVENTSANVITISFTTPITGTAIVVAPATIDVPEMKATVISAGDGTVVIDADGIRIAGQNVLTSANISTEVNSTVTSAISTTIGTLSNLTTTAKGNIVAAINEVNSAVTTWANLPYDVGSTVVGKPTASETVLRFRAVRPFTVQSSGHEIVANVAATGSTVFTVTKNTTSIGSITFAAAATVPTVTVTATSFAAGDKLIITAPSVVDATLADIDLTLIAKLN